MVVGLLLLGSLVVNALLAVVAFARFVYYDGPSNRPDSMLFAGVILAVGVAELGVFGYAVVQSVGTGSTDLSNIGVLVLNSLLILFFILYLERNSLQSATARLRSAGL
jgi:hypothetical protein